MQRQPDNDRLDPELLGVFEEVAVIGIDRHMAAGLIFGRPAVLFHQTAAGR